MFFKKDNTLDLLNVEDGNLRNYKNFINNPNQNKEDLQAFEKQVEEKHKRLEEIEKTKQELLKNHEPQTVENQKIKIERSKEKAENKKQYKNDDFEYATFLDRFLATMMDILIVIVPISIAEAIAMMLNKSIINNIFFEWVLPIFITIIFWMKLGGTPGKLIMKMYVVDENTGEYLTATQSFIRYIGYFVSTICAFMGFIWIAFDDKKQAWHDKIAGTVVIRKKVEKVRFS
ncbi:MAG: RDD family protein [Sulfurospirillaceae bacterium]|nr:RDD family protein [Sulfurospirillaceae bacterium]